MSDRPSKTMADLTSGWPEEAGNEELARLGQELFAAREELPQIALDRIQIRMRREMNRPWWQRRWRSVLAGLVALMAIGMGVYAWIAPHAHQPSPDQSTQTAKTAVQDRFQVTLPSSSPKPPEKPLIDLQKNNNLFRQGKEPKR